MPETMDHSRLRESLLTLQRCIESTRWRFPIPYAETRELGQFQIHISYLSLDGGNSLKPRFFAPLPSACPLLQALTPEFIACEYDTDFPNLPEPIRTEAMCDHVKAALDAIIPQALSHGQYPWTTLEATDERFSQLPHQQGRFGPYWITYHQHSSRPHIKCIMSNNQRVQNDRVSSNEVLMAINLMLMQMHDPRFNNHMIVPVLLIVMEDSHARVIEAYFDGKTLTVRKTIEQLYREGSPTFIRTMARVFLAEPLGNTSQAAFDRLSPA
ncbi:hypothetical protein P170DRAFT_476292 [Aspergillus steynii IBT 23096]|uniref:Uncharacterized protein n=1 Tax=Aspergillus steynii IBT 23096 TaxID=1392250 RepID=A0A2I2G400_9EURO|nr:uncharacterized protein P170DRAFT_476292 [Aspergillus steynii IBT 23096]PLB47610.1 hypothetical protein P170DRAFT_476292 [Aspergillus steynii IBT 23096]